MKNRISKTRKKIGRATVHEYKLYLANLLMQECVNLLNKEIDNYDFIRDRTIFRREPMQIVHFNEIEIEKYRSPKTS